MSEHGAFMASLEVAPGIFQIQVPIPYPLKYVNCYLIKGEGTALVDCALDTQDTKGSLALPAGKEVLRAALLEHGLRFSDLDQLVITHHHPDHYGLAGILEAEGAKVSMLDVELEHGHRFWTEPEEHNAAGLAHFQLHGVPEETLAGLAGAMAKTRSRVHPAKAPVTLKDGDYTELAGMKFKVVWTPGHADGHAVALTEDARAAGGTEPPRRQPQEPSAQIRQLQPRCEERRRAERLYRELQSVSGAAMTSERLSRKQRTRRMVGLGRVRQNDEGSGGACILMGCHAARAGCGVYIVLKRDDVFDLALDFGRSVVDAQISIPAWRPRSPFSLADAREDATQSRLGDERNRPPEGADAGCGMPPDYGHLQPPARAPRETRRRMTVNRS